MISDSKLDEAENILRKATDSPWELMERYLPSIAFTLQIIKELKWRRSGDQHTCHAQCENLMCVMRRELDWSKKMLERAKELAEDSLGEGPDLRARQFIEDLEAGPKKENR
jgi:hypothetical protein